MSPTSSRRFWIVPLAVLVALGAGMGVAAGVHVRGFERDLRAQVAHELEAVLDLQAAQIEAWSDEVVKDAVELLEGGPGGELAALAAGRAGPEDAAAALALLRRRVRHDRLETAALVDARGRVLLATSARGNAGADELAALEQAARAGAPEVRALPGLGGRLVVAAPLRDDRGRITGGLLMEARLDVALPGRVRGGAPAGSGAELLLGFVAGKVVHPVRLAPQGAPALAPAPLPLDGDALLARAARGGPAAGAARDERGVSVLFAQRRLRDGVWVLLAKVGEAGRLAPAAERARSLVIAVASLLAAAALVMLAWLRAQAAGLARRKRAVEERARQHRLEHLWKHAHDIVLLLAEDGRILEANDRALEAYGYAREELCALHASDLRPPEERAEEPSLLSRLRQAGALRYEALHRRKDGTTFPVEVSARAFTDDGQHLVFSIARDVTDRKRAEQAARLQASLLSRLNDAVVASDREGRVTAWTGAAERIYGRSAAEVLGRPLLEVFGADYGLFAQLDGSDGRRTIRSDCVHRAKDGTRLDVEVTTLALRDDTGKLVGQLSVNRDVTEARRTALALQQHQERLQLALEVSEVGIGDVDLRTGELHVSPRLMAMLGADRPDSRIEELLARVHAQDARRVLEAYQDLVAGRVEKLESEFRLTGAADALWVRAHGKVVERDGLGRAVRLVATLLDVSEERRLHAHLLFADRLASIGTLAAGVAHEINNPLSYLLANFEFLEERLRDRPEAVDGQELEAVREARDGARRIAEIVRGLRIFSRADRDAAPAVIDLREPVRSAARIAEPQIRGRAHLTLRLDEVPHVRCSEHEMAQVALNLLVNAAQAVPAGQPERNEILLATRTEEGRAVLEVRDTGVGIPVELLPRIFDPFFTTKSVGEGTGLGLSICHGIVEALGGTIAVQSTPGQGTTFRVVLPRAASVASAELHRPQPALARRGRVLVLDDEPLVCRALSRTLGGEHDVVAMTQPAEALARLARGDPFDLVVCDLMMPGVTGMQCYRAVAASRPELARSMVFLTGGAFTEEARAFLDSVPNARIEKPFDADALRAVVAQEIGRAQEVGADRSLAASMNPNGCS